jgi:hypothetical protein
MQLTDHENDHNTSFILASEVLDRFYAPVEFDAMAGLAFEFNQTKERIIEVHQTISQERVSGVLNYFFAGNDRDQYGSYASIRHTSSFNEVFRLEGALNHLTATFWQRALDQTNLLEIMPQERRSQWHKTLNAWRERDYKPGVNPEMDMPEFTLDNLRSTLQALMARRTEFVAERVDGIFRALSQTHVTNTPEAFQKRMIMHAMFNDWGSTCHQRIGFVHDLRLVISKFMGRDEPDRRSTESIMKTARHNTGEWIECDGGSLRVRGYKVGTAHLEVHPEMAWRLNGILAFLYPAAIPESSRRAPKASKAKGFKSRPLFERPISNAVISVLCQAEEFYTLEKSTSFRRDYDRKSIRNSLAVKSGSDISKHVLAEVDAIMGALGGVAMNGGKNMHMRYWQFDYPPQEIVMQVVAQGYLPDQRSYQYYPTPANVTEKLLDMAELTNDDIILGEPAEFGKNRTLRFSGQP